MARSPQEIFQHHAEALMAGDLDEIVADYTDDAVVITPRGAVPREGRRARRLSSRCWGIARREVGRAGPQIFEGDVLFIEWTAETPTARERDGIDTFVFTDDGIRAQTVRFTPEPVG